MSIFLLWNVGTFEVQLELVRSFQLNQLYWCWAMGIQFQFNSNDLAMFFHRHFHIKNSCCAVLCVFVLTQMFPIRLDLNNKKNRDDVSPRIRLFYIYYIILMRFWSSRLRDDRPKNSEKKVVGGN